MRLSVNKNDIGYRFDAMYYQPYLNGEPIDGVITADEEKGEIHRIVGYGKGQYLKEDELGKLRVEILYGHVKLKNLRGKG